MTTKKIIGPRCRGCGKAGLVIMDGKDVGKRKGFEYQLCRACGRGGPHCGALMKLRGVKTDAREFPNSTLAAMAAYGAPMTREEFLNWEFMGEVPEVIDAELEQAFPREFRSNYEEENPESGKSNYQGQVAIVAMSAAGQI